MGKIDSMIASNLANKDSMKITLSNSDADIVQHNFLRKDKFKLKMESIGVRHNSLNDSFVLDHPSNSVLFYENDSAIPQSLWGNLVAWYRFDGNSEDSSFNNNDGLVSNAILVDDSYGNPNSAYSFNGADARINLSTLGFSNTTPITISGIFKLNADGTNVPTSQPIVATDNFYVYVRGTTNELHARYDSLASARQSTFILGNGDRTKHHFVACFDGVNKTKIYVDGELKDSDTHVDSPKVIPYNGGISYIGFHNGGYFNGVIENISLLNKFVSDDEAKLLYTSNMGVVLDDFLDVEWSGNNCTTELTSDAIVTSNSMVINPTDYSSEFYVSRNF